MLSVALQLGTIQVDYNLPERFQLEYMDLITKASFGNDSPRTFRLNGTLVAVLI